MWMHRERSERRHAQSGTQLLQEGKTGIRKGWQLAKGIVG